MPVDVAAIGCDFYAFSGHKMLAPTGSGALWGRRALLEAMPPFIAGGEMIREVHLRRSEFNDDPVEVRGRHAGHLGRRGPRGGRRLPAATSGMDNVREHERELVAYALEVLPRDGARRSSSTGRRPTCAAASCRSTSRASTRTTWRRCSTGSAIAVRAGHHCTMPLHERLDLAATARASFGVLHDEGRHRRAGRRAPAGRQAVRGRGLGRSGASRAAGRGSVGGRCSAGRSRCRPASRSGASDREAAAASSNPTTAGRRPASRGPSR